MSDRAQLRKVDHYNITLNSNKIRRIAAELAFSSSWAWPALRVTRRAGNAKLITTFLAHFVNCTA